MSLPLSGKVALVTGSSRGIGAAIARRLAADGAAVAINYVRAADAAQQLADEITAAGAGSAVILQADMASVDAGRRLVEETVQRLGRLDVLVLNAGTSENQALEALTADPRNVVYIISGRDGAFLEQHLGHIKNLGMSAEHGGFIREPGEATWSNFTESLDMSWMTEVLEIFKYYTERTTGSHIEVKKSSITWHYRSADPEWG